MLHKMGRNELAQFLGQKLRPIEAILQKHLPEYCQEWDQLVKAVAWLLRRNLFWDHPHKSERLVIHYDFVPLENNDLYNRRLAEVRGNALFFLNSRVKKISYVEEPTQEEQEKVIIIQDYFKEILRNLESILNIRFERRTLHNSSLDTRTPQLRLNFYREFILSLGDIEGLSFFPGKNGGGDIWIGLDKPLKKIKTTIVHELGHALGLDHFHSNGSKDCVDRQVRGHGICVTPIHNLGQWQDRDILQRYPNIFNTALLYDCFTKWSNFLVDGHFGFLDYMALICVYGPNPSSELRHMTDSCRQSMLLSKDINLVNYEKIKKVVLKQTIPLKPQYQRSKFHVANIPISLGLFSKRSLQLNDVSLPRAFTRIEGGELKVATDISACVDGFTDEIQISSYQKVEDPKYYNFEVLFSPTTSVPVMRGSSDEDVFFFNKKMQYASGRDGTDTYCFYQDRWSQHRIKERPNGEANYIILYQPQLDYLYAQRVGSDLILFDERKPNERSIRMIGYFQTKETSHYTILVVHQQNLLGADNIPCSGNQLVSVVNEVKLHNLRTDQDTSLAECLSYRWDNELFQQRLGQRLKRQGPNQIIASSHSVIQVDRQNPYGTVVRLNGMISHINQIQYKRQGKDLVIAWQSKEGIFKSTAFGFFKNDATPLHLVDAKHNHLVTFNGMNGYGPPVGVVPERITPDTTHKVCFNKLRREAVV